MATCCLQHDVVDVLVEEDPELIALPEGDFIDGMLGLWVSGVAADKAPMRGSLSFSLTIVLVVIISDHKYSELILP